MTIALVPWIVLAGGTGALVRYLLITALPLTQARPLPRGVLVVNLLGSLIAGITLGLVYRSLISMDVALIVWVGFCGGLTTFSTVAVETILIGRERPRLGWWNIGVTTVGGCACAAVGFAFAGLLGT